MELYQQANQNNYQKNLPDELSHISEEVESKFDETSGNQTIKSRFQNKFLPNGNNTHYSMKDSVNFNSSCIQSMTPVRSNN